MAVELISKSAYARRRGCDEKAVRKAIAEGRISAIDGKIDPAVADIQWERNTRARVKANAAPPQVQTSAQGELMGPDPVAEPAPTQVESPAVDTYSAWRGRREAAEAEMAELKVAEQRGELISVAAIEAVWSSALAATREHLLQVRARLAPLLAAEADVFKVEQMLEYEHRKALELLAAADAGNTGASG